METVFLGVEGLSADWIRMTYDEEFIIEQGASENG